MVYCDRRHNSSTLRPSEQRERERENIHYRNIDMIINNKKVDPDTPAKTSLVANAEATKI